MLLRAIAQLVRVPDCFFGSLKVIYYICYMNNSSKGNIGELMVLADLTRNGIPAFKPVDNNSPFDILIYHNSAYKRVQVKYRNVKNGSITAELVRCTINQGKKSKIERNNETDILAIYCPDTNECYYINSQDVGKTIALRIDQPKNGQTKVIRYARDYTNLAKI